MRSRHLLPRQIPERQRLFEVAHEHLPRNCAIGNTVRPQRHTDATSPSMFVGVRALGCMFAVRIHAWLGDQLYDSQQPQTATCDASCGFATNAVIVRLYGASTRSTERSSSAQSEAHCAPNRRFGMAALCSVCDGHHRHTRRGAPAIIDGERGAVHEVLTCMHACLRQHQQPGTRVEAQGVNWVSQWCAGT